MTYGVYATEVMQVATQRMHRPEDSELSISAWTDGDTGSAEDFADQVKPTTIAAHLQSTLSLDQPTRERMVLAARRGARSIRLSSVTA